ARRRTPGAPGSAVRTGRRLPGVPRFRGPRTAADRGPARPAPAAPQRMDRPPLGRPGLPPGLPLVCQRALLGRPDSDAARATGGTGRGAVAAVLPPHDKDLSMRLALLSACLLPGLLHAASFDCARAQHLLERTICADARL